MTELRETLKDLAETCREEFQQLKEQEAHREDISDKEEAVTEVDKKMTQIVIETFKQRPETFRFVSEELEKASGTEEADYTVVFDEIDGTGNMKNERGPFGPIVGVAEGNDPRFEDVVATFFQDLRNNDLYEAYRNEGAYLNGEEISTSGTEGLEEVSTSIVVDQISLAKRPELAELFWKYYPKDYGSQAFQIALVASGRADAAVTGSYGFLKEKNTAEEVGPLYLLVREAGGAVTDWNGEDLGGERIGLGEGLSYDYIAAASENLGEEISEELDSV